MRTRKRIIFELLEGSRALPKVACKADRGHASPLFMKLRRLRATVIYTPPLAASGCKAGSVGIEQPVMGMLRPGFFGSV